MAGVWIIGSEKVQRWHIRVTSVVANRMIAHERLMLA